jgi:hypothetical protein
MVIKNNVCVCEINANFFVELFTDDSNIEPSLLIDNAHDMGVLAADFCKITRLDRKRTLMPHLAENDCQNRL